MLYHLAEPTVAIHEAWPVLAYGGLFVAATPSRDDSPELAQVWREPSRFDAASGVTAILLLCGFIAFTGPGCL